MNFETVILGIIGALGLYMVLNRNTVQAASDGGSLDTGGDLSMVDTSGTAGGDPRIDQVRMIAWKYHLDPSRAIAAWQLAQDQASQIAIDPALLMAIWHKESTFNPSAVNLGDPSYGLGAVETFWIDGRIGIFGTQADLLNATFNAQASAHVLMYFMGQTVLPDLRPGSPTNGKKLFPYRYFNFPDEADIYNVGEHHFREGLRNLAYLNAVKQFFGDWSTTR